MRSAPWSVITVNRASSRDTPPLYAAKPTANGTHQKSPARAVSVGVEASTLYDSILYLYFRLTSLCNVFHFSFCFPSSQLQPTTSHLLSNTATTRTTSSNTGIIVITSITSTVIRNTIKTRSNSRVTTCCRNSGTPSRAESSSC